MALTEKGTLKELAGGLGIYGFKKITSEVVNPDAGYYFFAIDPLEDSSITTEGNVLTAQALTENHIVYGVFTSAVCVSGSAIAYQMKDMSI
jgi:hypothetical protein